jgi:hypothetical protein
VLGFRLLCSVDFVVDELTRECGIGVCVTAPGVGAGCTIRLANVDTCVEAIVRVSTENQSKVED